MKLTIKEALDLGIKAHREGKPQEAERFYRAVLKTQPKNSDANHNLGLLAVAFNKTNMALPFFKAALKNKPRQEQHWLSYIDALIKLENFKNAKQEIKKARKNGVNGENLNAREQQIIPKNNINLKLHRNN